METCDHCGTSCKTRVAVMMRGRVAMVGTGCAKKFKRAKRSDLYKAVILGPSTISADQPKQVTEQEFHDKFKSKIHSTKNVFSGVNVVEWYLFHGVGLAISVRNLPVAWPYNEAVAVRIYDPYTGKHTKIGLLYNNNPLLGDTVEQESAKFTPGYSQVVQDFLDIYPKWDPIAVHVPGSVRKSPGYTAPTAPIAIAPSGAGIPPGRMGNWAHKFYPSEWDSLIFTASKTLAPQSMFQSINIVHLNGIVTFPDLPPKNVTPKSFGDFPDFAEFTVRFNKYSDKYSHYRISTGNYVGTNKKISVLGGNWTAVSLYNLLAIQLDPYIVEEFHLIASILYTLGWMWVDASAIHVAPVAKQPRVVQGTFDFGAGLVNAHQHPNGLGWVADTAKVGASVFVGPNAMVFDYAEVWDMAQISDYAKVHGKAKVYDNAMITGNAKVHGKAKVYDNAMITGNAEVSAEVSGDSKIGGDARVMVAAKVFNGAVIEGEALITDRAEVYGEAHVSGKALIGSDARVYGYAKIKDNASVVGEAKVHDRAIVEGVAEIKGYARVFENAKIYGRANVYGTARVSGNAKVSGTSKVHDDSSVFGQAKVYDGAEIKGEANIFSSAIVRGLAIVGDNASVQGDAIIDAEANVYGNSLIHENALVEGEVYGSAEIFGDCKVVGKAKVYGYAKVLGNAQLNDNAKVYSYATVEDYAMVEEDAEVFGNAIIKDHAIIKGTAKVGGRITVGGNTVMT